MSEEEWRVVMADGTVRRVKVESALERNVVEWCAGSPKDGYGHGASARAAVVELCAVSSWDAAEILSPDEASASERVRQEQARCVAACRRVLESCVPWSDGAAACIAEIGRHAL